MQCRYYTFARVCYSLTYYVLQVHQGEFELGKIAKASVAAAVRTDCIETNDECCWRRGERRGSLHYQVGKTFLQFTTVCLSFIKFFLIKSFPRRLTHYTSMATVAGPGGAPQASPVLGQESPVHQTLGPGGRPPGHLTVSDTSRTSSARTSGQPTVPNTKASGHLAVSNTRTSGPLSVSNTRTQNPERQQIRGQGGGKRAPDKKYR